MSMVNHSMAWCYSLSTRRCAQEPSHTRQPSVRLYVALPNHEHLPAQILERGLFPRVTASVLPVLALPKLDIAPRPAPAVCAVVSMPEATVHEDDFAARRKREVRMTRKVGGMQRVPITEPMQSRAHDEFWLGVLPANSRHQRAACAWR